MFKPLVQKECVILSLPPTHAHIFLHIGHEHVERVQKFKFLGVNMTDKLCSIAEKAHQYLYYLRADLTQKLFGNFSAF